MKVSETLRYDMSVGEARLLALAHERENAGGESCPKDPRFHRADVGILES